MSPRIHQVTSPALQKCPSLIPTRTETSDLLGIFREASGFSTKGRCKDFEEGSQNTKHIQHTQCTGILKQLLGSWVCWLANGAAARHIAGRWMFDYKNRFPSRCLSLSSVNLGSWAHLFPCCVVVSLTPASPTSQVYGRFTVALCQWCTV